MRFVNREEAGKELARALESYTARQGVVVYALPRGGVVLGFQVANYLHAPLDLIIVRKIGHPHMPEYAICAIAENGDPLCNEKERAAVDASWLARAIKEARREARRRRSVYLKGRMPIPAGGKIAIIVDDGVATGLTMRLAVRELKRQGAKKIAVAVPVIPVDTADIVRKEADELVALEIPSDFLGAIGSYYDEFPQVEDAQVVQLLDASASA